MGQSLHSLESILHKVTSNEEMNVLPKFQDIKRKYQWISRKGIVFRHNHGIQTDFQTALVVVANKINDSAIEYQGYVDIRSTYPWLSLRVTIRLGVRVILEMISVVAVEFVQHLLSEYPEHKNADCNLSSCDAFEI